MSVLEAPVRRSSTARRSDLSGRRVLVMVRDEVAAARYVSTFKLFGAQAIPAFSADEVLAQLRLHQPDAVVCDLDNAEVGLHLIRRIRMRSRLDGGATPALAMTSALVPSLQTRAMLAGFQACSSSEPLELLLAAADLLGDCTSN
jgi:CheY-like chemotaxis protein